jgi:hypothetical protein
MHCNQDPILTLEGSFLSKSITNGNILEKIQVFVTNTYKKLCMREGKKVDGEWITHNSAW